MKFLAKMIAVLVVLGACGWLGLPYLQTYWNARNKPSYRFASVTRGDLVLVVNSTGTVQPESKVSVGSFVSGPIKKLLVDFDSPVTEGQVLAKIDPRIYEANRDRDQAMVHRPRPTSPASRPSCSRPSTTRCGPAIGGQGQRGGPEVHLRHGDGPATSSAAWPWRPSSLAKATVKQAEGNLQNSETNVSYTEIRSPVDGIVIDRKIDPGQTLAAPVPDARDVRRGSGDGEADARLRLGRRGRHRPDPRGQEAASSRCCSPSTPIPDDLFEGKISQIRLNPTTTQNVVTYTVVVEAPNPELKLLPGMTANLSFQMAETQAAC